MKISVITSRYAISGVPLAQQRFSHALSTYGHDVEFVISHLYQVEKKPKIAGVKVRVFGKVRAIQMLFPLIHYFKQSKPDVVFTAGDHLNVIVTIAVILSRSKVKISASSRVTPYDTYSNTLFSKRWILKQLFRLTMFRVNVLTCVSSDMVKQYQDVFKNPPHVCVYNIVNDIPSRKKMLEQIDDKWFMDKTEPIIVAGMLEPWKGFKDLILAVNEVLKTRNVKLVIFGEGSMREELQSQIDKLGHQKSIRLFGHVANPLKYFKNSNVSVLSSYVEGLPNVLVEAMMCGCTPVSTDCPTGPSEVLQNGKYGYLVPMNDPVAMSRGIKKALDNPIPKTLLDEAVVPFSEDAVIKRHFELLGFNDFGKCSVGKE